MREMDNNAVNIDSSEFKVDAYMKAIMKDYSLNRLLEKENELTKEIKLLDNDMQSLVYENYNKFINATDIVQNLKENFVTMETLLKDLSTKMEKISQSNNAMSTELKPKKDRISNLVGINNTLQKLQYLFDLPTNLNDLIAQNSYMEALRQFTNALNIFHKHKKLKTFADIYTECQTIMKDLYSELLELAYENKTKDEPNLYEVFEVLSGLENAGITCDTITPNSNASTLSSLKDHFLEIMDKRLRQETQNLIETYENSTESNLTKTKEYMKFADEACDGFLKSLASYLTYYRLLFLQPQNVYELNTFDRENGKRLISVAQAVFTNFMDRALKPFYCCGAGLAPSEILVVRSLDKICQKVRDLSESSGQQLFDQKPPQAAVRRNATEAFGRNNEPVSSKGRLFDFDQMFTHNFLLPAVQCRIIAHQEICCHNLGKLVLNVKHKLVKLPPGIAAENVNYLGEINKNFIATLTENIKNTMNKLKCYTSPEDATFANDPNFIETFGKSFIFGNFLFPFYRHLADVFEKLQSKHTEDNLSKDTSQVLISNAGDGLKENSGSMAQITTPLALLLFSRVAYDFCTTTYDELITFAHQTFSSKRYVGTAVGGNSLKSSSRGNEIKGVAAIDIVSKSDFKGAATRLVNAYVLRQGFTVSQLIQKSVQTRDWLRTLEPRNVRAAMKRVVEELTLTDAQVGQIYEEGVKKLNTTSSDSSRRAATSQFRHSQSSLGIGRLAKNMYPPAPGTTTNNTYHSSNTTIQRANILNSHIYKLFSEKIVIYETVDLNKISIMTGIVKICLKTFLESIRLKTLSTYGFQQIQVDVNYLQLYLWRFVSSEKILQTLLDEIISTAALRCTNPILMEQSVIDVICER